MKVIAFDPIILDENIDGLNFENLMFFGRKFSAEMDSEAYLSKKSFHQAKTTIVWIHL